MRNISILKKLAAEGKTFSVDDQGLFGEMERQAVLKMLHRMERSGLVERIERGKYMVVPLDANKGSHTLHEFVIGSALVEPYCVAYWSALSYHGMTEQIPGEVYIQTTSRRKRSTATAFGVTYRFVRVGQAKFFGARREWVGDDAVCVTDREKTIADCLDKPQHCGGVVEAAKALAKGGLDSAALSGYAVRMGNSGVVRRLGYLCELLSIDIDLPAVRARNYLLLDPTMPRQGLPVATWRLKVNLDSKALGALE